MIEINQFPEVVNQKTLVIRIDWWLWRVISSTWAITAIAKTRPVKVITSRPLAFWWNPYIQSVHWLDDRWLFWNVIRWNDYIELEPYTDPRFFNDAVNWLEIYSDKLWLDKTYNPELYLAEHEKLNAIIPNDNSWRIPVLFQPFGSTMQQNWADKSYRSIKVEDAQYIADLLNQNWFYPVTVDRADQPKLNWCESLWQVTDMRFVISLANNYPLIAADSCMHHASVWFWKQSVVIWAWTDAERFWYDFHINLREHPLVAHTPMRLPMNDFDLDISNQYTNQFSKEFLEDAVKKFVDMVKR